MSISTKRIAVTGGAGQIAYSFLFRLVNGEVFGPDHSLILHLLEVPPLLGSLEGVKMELQDCAFPLLEKIEVTADPYQAFRDIDFAFLIGAKPRGAGMERKDLLQDNGRIFAEQGKALNAVAHPDAKVFVVGNPCNTNCLIAMSRAPRLSRKNFFAMTRLDQNRATFLLAEKAHLPLSAVSNVIIWGNHSSTQVPDFFHARLQGHPAEEVIQDRHWLEHDFIQLVQKRGAAVIQARGKSSAASAAHALIQAARDLLFPTPLGNCYSVATIGEGNPYGIEEELVFSFPYRTLARGERILISGLEMPEWLENKIKITEQELLEERECIKSFIS